MWAWTAISYHLGKQADEQESIRIMRTAIDNGVNFMDNCWDYNDGASESRMGKALRDGYRQQVFLMTKIDGRTKNAAAKQIDESLHRLQTDRIDLLQFHEVIGRQTQTASSGRTARWRRCWTRSKRARCATLVSPDTRARRSTYTCSTRPSPGSSRSMRCKCP